MQTVRAKIVFLLTGRESGTSVDFKVQTEVIRISSEIAIMNFSASGDYHGDGRYLQRRVIADHIGKITFGPEDNVLDVGCGTGEETKSIASKVSSVTGIDISEEMLAFAKENNSATNITYCIGDAQTVGDNPEWREKFDKVVSLCVLHWVPDKPKALRSILDCLKPGREALFIVNNGKSLDIVQFFRGHTKWANYVKGFKSTFRALDLSIRDTEDLFKSCGWTDVKCELGHAVPTSEQQTKLFFKTSYGLTALIPESEQEAYLEDLWQWTLSRYGDTSKNGAVLLPIGRTVIHARKPL